MKIVFVCLGNICRSPMAEFIAKKYAKDNNLSNVEISSCGTSNYHEGEGMHQGTDDILTKYQINHKGFKSQPITREIFNDADYLVTMDNQNYQQVITRFGENKKIIKITNYCDFNYNEVPDPWYTNNFEETYKILSNSIINFFKAKKINCNS